MTGAAPVPTTAPARPARPRLTIRNELVYRDGKYIGWFNLRTGQLYVEGFPVVLPVPACYGTRMVGVSATLVRAAVREVLSR